jgi:hypothetical protein
MEERSPIRCLCWIDGIRTPAPPIKGWDGMHICREHLSQSIARSSGQSIIEPTPGLADAPPMLQ